MAMKYSRYITYKRTLWCDRCKANRLFTVQAEYGQAYRIECLKGHIENVEGLYYRNLPHKKVKTVKKWYQFWL